MRLWNHNFRHSCQHRAPNGRGDVVSASQFDGLDHLWPLGEAGKPNAPAVSECVQQPLIAYRASDERRGEAVCVCGGGGALMNTLCTLLHTACTLVANATCTLPAH